MAFVPLAFSALIGNVAGAKFTTKMGYRILILAAALIATLVMRDTKPKAPAELRWEPELVAGLIKKVYSGDRARTAAASTDARCAFRRPVRRRRRCATSAILTVGSRIMPYPE